MMQHRIRSIDHEFSELSDLHAVVDIIECDGKFLRKSAHGVKYGAFAHHAGRRDGAVILSAHCPVEVAVLGFVEPDKRVSRNASESDDNAGMLDRIILIEKSCADNSDVLSLGKAEHLLDKVLCNQLDIVVHEQKVFALCMLYAEVVDRGIVELPLPADNVYIREFLLDLLIVSPCRLFCAVVLHDDKLEVLVRPFRQHRAAALRNAAKDGIKKMKALYLPGDVDSVFSDMDACRGPIRMLLELAEEFSARFQEAKEEKNLVDFNDLEHFALEILTGGSPDHRPGAVADELSGIYEEILVDEYQDSNEVQETLIRCVSRERFGTPNVFMVGDVKQSIYKFRLAKPELFLEKYESYGNEDDLYQKIELHKNFRSRREVLESINDVFYQIMTKQLGNICYTDDAALYAGAKFPETPEEGQAKTEVLLLNTGDPLFDGMDEEKADYTAREAEARLIAAKIRELTDPESGMQIYNGKPVSMND